jgi:hypothetical protein
MTTFQIIKQLDDVVKSSLSYTFNKNARRFADKSTGKFLSQNKVKDLLSTGISDKSDRLQKLGKDLSTGKIDLTKFLTEGAQTVKELHILNAVVAVNGRADQMTKQQLATLQERVNGQLKPYFGDLIKELSRGEVSEAQLLNRLRMYSDSALLTQKHIELDLKKEQGYDEGFRQLGGSVHCQSCIRYASLGWVDIDELILPGEECECRSQCKCSILYRTKKDA